MLDAVPQSKAAKSDAELDVKTLLEVVVAGRRICWGRPGGGTDDLLLLCSRMIHI